MVTIEEIKKLASLAKLRLTDEELKRMSKDLSSIIAFADTINSVSELTPEETVAAKAASRTDSLRPDIAAPSVSAEAILKNAGGGENGYFRIRKRK